MILGVDTAPEILLSTATLRYGPLKLRFRTASGDTRLSLRYPHTLFRAGDEESADTEVVCELGDASPIAGVRIFDANGVWELRRGENGQEQVYYPIRGQNGEWEPLMSLTFDPSMRSARYVRRRTPDDGGVIVLAYPVDEYLSSRLLARRGGMILHASSVKVGERALLFLGHSGAGKSTIAEFASSAGAEVLTDDRTIVTLDQGTPHPRAWGTPWHGTCPSSSAASAPLAAMFLLIQDVQDALAPVNSSRAFSEAFVRMYQPTEDRGEVERVIDSLRELVGRVPMYQLRCRKSPAGFELARSVAVTYH